MKRTAFYGVKGGFALLMLSGLSLSAYAAEEMGDLDVTAEVINSCILIGNTLNFGQYNPTSVTDTQMSVVINVTCTKDHPYNVALGQGLNVGEGSSDDTPKRRLKLDETNYLNYELYSDSFGGTLWGNSITSDISSVGNGQSQPFTVYGQITKNQIAKAGIYNDKVVITVTY
jgi:spore coat protein U-like protein